MDQVTDDDIKAMNIVRVEVEKEVPETQRYKGALKLHSVCQLFLWTKLVLVRCMLGVPQKEYSAWIPLLSEHE